MNYIASVFYLPFIIPESRNDEYEFILGKDQPPNASRILASVGPMADNEVDFLETLAINERKGIRIEIDASTDFKLKSDDTLWILTSTHENFGVQWMQIRIRDKKKRQYAEAMKALEPEIFPVDDTEDLEDGYYEVEGEE